MAGLSPLLNFNGSLSYAACLELFTAVCASNYGLIGVLESLLRITGGGEVLLWQYDPGSITVDYSVSKQGNHYLVAIAGTTSATQWAGHVVGAVAAFYKGGLTFVNSFWQALLASQRSRVLAMLPPPGPGLRFTVTGHSLGGAIAQLAGNDLAEIYGPENVDVLTFSQPKALTGGYSGPTPSIYRRLVRPGDPVPYLPPRVTASLWTPFAGPGAVSLSTGLLWSHYGEGWLLRDDATLTQDPGEYLGGWLDAARFSYLSFAEHLPKNIARVLVRRASEA